MVKNAVFGAPSVVVVNVDGLESERDGRIINKANLVNYSFRKRAFDIAFSLCLIVFVFSWLFPIIMLAIIIESGLPVFFFQDRVGLNGRYFKCFKFRSMRRADSKKVGNNLYTPTAKNDSRITRVGKFLRKTNLDELPQFFNVLKGDMSVVGPRPHAISFHNKYQEMIQGFDIEKRHLVRPGITGLSQINGYRGDVADQQENKIRTKTRIRFDILYIDKWTPYLDLHIVFRTFWNMVKQDTKGH